MINRVLKGLATGKGIDVSSILGNRGGLLKLNLENRHV